MEKTTSTTLDLQSNYVNNKVQELRGRYITYRHIEPVLKKLENKLILTEEGKSTSGTSIPMLQFGHGKIKILVWSQMHGNESTTTKAVLDLLNLFSSKSNSPFEKLIEEQITLKVIPMLNPDGALAYTRVNANEIDLNRDAHDRTQVESKILRKIFDDFQPDYCFNLHDQRTIFSAGDSASPATISFLTPAMNAECTVTPSRIRSMKVVVAINEMLQKLIPWQVGRYDDAYNINCTGDTFQTLEVPTILFEAGHYENDYERENTRELIFHSLITALSSIATGEAEKLNHQEYFKIPENQKLFYDMILRNVCVNGDILDVAIQFKEVLEGGVVVCNPIIEKMSFSLPFFGHKEIECEKKELKNIVEKSLSENDIVHKLLLKNEVLIVNNANY